MALGAPFDASIWPGRVKVGGNSGTRWVLGEADAGLDWVKILVLVKLKPLSLHHNLNR